MESEFVSVILFTLLSYLSWFFSKQFITHGKTFQDQNQDDTEYDRRNRKLKPIPETSLLKILIPTMLFDERRAINMMLRIGKLDPIVKCVFWKIGFVVINDLKMGKEMFKNLELCSRPTQEVTTFYAKGEYGLSWSNGLRWKEQRRFCHQHLKVFGFGKQSMEVLIHDEITDHLNNWSAKNSLAFSPNRDFNIPIISSLWMILAGERVTFKNAELMQHALKVYGCFKQAVGLPDCLLFAIQLYPGILKQIASRSPIFAGYKLFRESTLDLRAYFVKVINAKKLSLDDGEPTNLVDVYLKEIRKTNDPESEFFGEKGEKHIIATMIDFFLAGGDTTANTLAWAMLHLIRNPSVQEKIFDEIQTIVGTDRLPSLSDRSKCPYTEAFLMETLRMNPLVATSTPHMAEEDVIIGPYFLLKGTVLTMNIYNIHHDPKIWGDPETFRPERFLTPDGKSTIRHEAMCEFSVGLRRCVGEQVARDNLFLFVSAICQRFILKPDPSLKELPPIRDIKSMIHAPDVFKMVAIDREKLIVEPK